MKKLLLVMVVLLLVGIANAATYKWEPTVIDPITGAAEWSVAENWSGATVPTSEDTILFRYDEVVDCLVIGDQTAKNVRVGRREAYLGVLRIMPGATLTAGGSRSYVGDDYFGQMTVERGGLFDTFSAIRVGENPGALGSILTINGGTVTTIDSFSLASAGGGGNVDLNGGLIEAAEGEGTAELMLGVDNTIDISFGKIVIHEDITTDVAEEIAAGRLTAFDGAGTVAYNLNGNTTTITSTDDPLERFPTYDEVVQVGDVDLSWVNLAPVGVPANSAPTEVWVDVWVGTDVATLSKVVDMGPGATTTGYTVSAPVFAEHVWRVDTYRNGDPSVFDYEVNDPNFVLDVGMTMYFVASDDEPPSVVINTPSTATWIDEPITLTATISDDDKSDVTIVWTSDEDPNAVFDPPTTTYPKGTVTYPLVSTTSVTVDYQTNYFTVTATVSDLNPLGETDSYTVEHHCAATPCGAARSQFDLDATNPADLDGDCDHDLADFAIIAEDYAAKYALTEAQVFE